MLASGYILLSILITLIIVFFSWRAAKAYYPSSSDVNLIVIQVSLFIIMWLAYLVLLSYFGLLLDLGLPPRFPIFLVIPLLTFSLYFYFKNKNNQFIQSIPLHWTAFFQSFRIAVEILIFYTFIAGIIPVHASFEGLNFDILMGISALPLGYVIFNTKGKYKSLLKAWNLLGIVMILFVAVIIATNIYQPQWWGYTESSVSLEFVQLPYLLLPGFLAPTGIFIHIISLIQLNRDHD